MYSLYKNAPERNQLVAVDQKGNVIIFMETRTRRKDSFQRHTRLTEATCVYYCRTGIETERKKRGKRKRGKGGKGADQPN